MNSEEPKKEVHFYGGCYTYGYFFIQNGNPEKVFSFGRGYNGELANGKSNSTNNNIYQYPTPQVCTKIPKTGKVKQISKGYFHALFLMSPKEDVYGVGYSGYGALSTNQKEVLSPILLSSSAIKDKKISSVSCGDQLSVLLSEKGVPYSCGYNSNGQCGVGTNSHIYSAIPMKFNEKVIQIDCGRYYTVLLTNKRDIYKTGKICNEVNVNIPTKLNLNEKVKYFRAGGGHLLVVGKSEQLYGMGKNEYNQLTSNISNNGINVLTRINSFNGKKIKDIKCGYEDSYALLENGELYGWGYNSYGQSKGNGSVTTSPTPFKMKSNVHHVEVGTYSCFAFCKDNCVYVCGYNGDGELGMGHETNISTFTLNKNITNIKKVTPKIFKPPTIQSESERKKLIQQFDDIDTEEDDDDDSDEENNEQSILTNYPSTSNSNRKKHANNSVKEIPKKEIKYIYDEDDEKIELGSGGQCEVFKCKWKGKMIALKVFKLEISFEYVKKEALKEIRAIQMLKHPLVIGVYGYAIMNKSKEKLGVALEFVDGMDLNKFIKISKVKKEQISNIEKWNIIKKIIEVVNFLHCKGVRHRDIKPDNFLISKDMKKLKIIDFGLAKVKKTTITRKGKAVGTTGFMAKEVILHSKYTFASDIFALGMTIYQIVSGERPFDGINDVTIVEKIKVGKLPKLNPKKTPKEFIEMYEMCCKMNYKDRVTSQQLIEFMESRQIDFLSSYFGKKSKKLINYDYFFGNTIVKTKKNHCSFCSMNDDGLVEMDSDDSDAEDFYGYYIPKCKHYSCVNCLVQKLKILKIEVKTMKKSEEENEEKEVLEAKRVEIECPKKGCKTILGVEWLIGTKNKKIIKFVRRIEQILYFLSCSLCNTMNDKRLFVKGIPYFKCCTCNKRLCTLCSSKYSKKRRECSNEACDHNGSDHDLLLFHKNTTYPFMFSLPETKRKYKIPKNLNGKIPRCRLCPVCDELVYRKNSPDCKHVTCDSRKCKGKVEFCFVCLSIGRSPKVNEEGVMEYKYSCGKPYDYCPLAPFQIEE